MFGNEEEAIPADKKSERIQELVKVLPPKAEEEATDLVRQAEDADEVIEGLEYLIDAHSPDSTDEAVSKAENLTHLEQMLASDGSVTSWVEKRVDVLTSNETAELREAMKEVPDSAESKANRLVRRAASAESLTEDLHRLTENHHEKKVNDVVANADSVSDLTSTIGDEEDVSAQKTGAVSLLDTLRDRTTRGVEEGQVTLENAEPREAAIWGILAGAAVMNPSFGAPAVAAETSTAALVGASALGGGALGAYASSHEESTLAEIDPAELFHSSKQLAAQSKDIEEIDGHTLGAVLGASSHLADILTPDAYSQWVINADAEAVLEGAALGARYSQKDDREISSRSGKAIGAGLGLLYSYVESGDSDDQLQRILEDGLWEEYQHELED